MFRTSIACAILLASTVIGSACAKNQTTSASTAPEAPSGAAGHPMMGSGMMPMMGAGDPCPMGVPGTAVQATETSDGMSMAFTTTGDAGEVRKRAHGMADRMNGQASGAMGMNGMMMKGGDGGGGMMMGSGMGHAGMMGDGGAGMMMGSGMGHAGMMMGGSTPPMNVQVDDIDGGARLRMTPRDPSRVAEMKKHVQQHAQMMNQGHGCPMMNATN
jgi:hypothetical protein